MSLKSVREEKKNYHPERIQSTLLDCESCPLLIQTISEITYQIMKRQIGHMNHCFHFPPVLSFLEKSVII